jgi:hypothetical protein
MPSSSVGIVRSNTTSPPPGAGVDRVMLAFVSDSLCTYPTSAYTFRNGNTKTSSFRLALMTSLLEPRCTKSLIEVPGLPSRPSRTSVTSISRFARPVSTSAAPYGRGSS